jgi:tRNA nucleotidyltransferase/poly(A) polymerase
MPHIKQPDLFGDDQPELFDEDAPPRVYRADPERVRARLSKILAEARAAETLPWDRGRLSLYQTIFPQMTNWLPDEEAAQLRFEFEAELKRLDAA